MSQDNFKTVLKGNLLRLEPINEEDFDSVYAAASDPLIWELHPNPLRYQKEVFKEFFKGAIDSNAGYKIIDNKTNEVMGSSRYYHFFPDQKIISIGYTFLARKYWGGIYNRELKDLMLRFAFSFTDTVIFDVGEKNFRSQKAMVKIGGEYIGKIEKTYPDGRVSTPMVYKIEKKNFKGLV
jgi:RimJ/RimL family protein N-acetyltransferase